MGSVICLGDGEPHTSGGREVAPEPQLDPQAACIVDSLWGQLTPEGLKFVTNLEN